MRKRPEELKEEVSEKKRPTVIYTPVKYLSSDLTFGDLSTSRSAVIKNEERDSGMSAPLLFKGIKCPPKHLKAIEVSSATLDRLREVNSLLFTVKDTLESERQTDLPESSLQMQSESTEVTSAQAKKKQHAGDNMSSDVKPGDGLASSKVPKLKAESSGAEMKKKVKTKSFKSVLSRKEGHIDPAPALKGENSEHMPEFKTEHAGGVQKSEGESDSTGNTFSRKREHSPDTSDRKVDSSGYKSPPKKSRLDKGRLMKSEIIWILEKRRKWWHKPVNLRVMSKEKMLELLDPEPSAQEMQELKERFQKASNLFPDLKLEDLQEELKKRGISYSGLARGELAQKLNEAMKAKKHVIQVVAKTASQRPEPKTGNLSGNLARTGIKRPESKTGKCQDKPTVGVVPNAAPDEDDRMEEADASAHNRWNCVIL